MTMSWELVHMPGQGPWSCNQSSSTSTWSVVILTTFKWPVFIKKNPTYVIYVLQITLMYLLYVMIKLDNYIT